MKTNLRPTEDLTRAEAAVLLYRLRQRLDLVKAQYKHVEETVLATETLTMVLKSSKSRSFNH